jgi:predicted transcriptional regulator
MEAKTTARRMLKNLLAEIAENQDGITVSRVCVKAGMNPSMMSRWKAKDIEPRLSTVERLQEAFAELKAEHLEHL